MSFLDSSKSSPASASKSAPGSKAPLYHIAKTMCLAVDATEHLKGAGITYISPVGTLNIRPPGPFISNNVIIEACPYSDGKSAAKGTYASRVLDAGFSCVPAGLAYSAVTTTCAAAPLTVGLTAPLCALSAGGVGLSTWQCAVAIGQLVNHAKDPRLADQLDNETLYPHWVKLNNGIKVANLPRRWPFRSGVIKGCRNN